MALEEEKELLFRVHGTSALRAKRLTLEEAGLWERRDLQEWVIKNPEILGSGIMIVTMEFDKWVSGSGRESDRLDILGLNTEGELVIAELKRDKAPETVEMQAIKYAAMASRFTMETLAAWHAKYLTTPEKSVEAEEAAEELSRFAEITDASLRNPRIVLLASDFQNSTITAAVWLWENGIKITLREYHAYQADKEIVISVSQLYPVPSIEQFLIAPNIAQGEKKVAANRGRNLDINTVSKILAGGLLADGTPLTLSPTSINPELRSQIVEWVAKNPSSDQAIWQNSAKALLWTFDNTAYTPSALAQHILFEATGLERAVRGPDWWITPGGQTLVQLASKDIDWSNLHAVLSAFPYGKWTSYGDLAKLVGTGARPLSNHVSRSVDCPNGHRVLREDGSVSPGFVWGDRDPADTRDIYEVLESEGVPFSGVKGDLDRKAEPSHRISTEALALLFET